MLNKKTYEALDILKDNNPDIYSVIDTFLNDSLKELSYAAHEIKNQISFLYSSYQLIEYRNPTIKNNEFWCDMGSSFEALIHFMERTSLYRNSLKSEPSTFNINDILFEIPDIIDNGYFYDNEFIFNTTSDCMSVTYDKEKIRTILTELTANACEVNDGPVTLKSYISSGNIIIDIINTTDKIISTGNIFTPFYTTKEQPHTGLGLSIVQMICLKQNIGLDYITADNTTTARLTFNTIS